MSRWFEVAWRHRLAALGVGVALLLAASMLWSLLVPHPDRLVEAIRQQGYPVSLAELDAWYPSVPAQENAALVYTNAFAGLTNSEGPITNFIGKNWLPPLGQGLLAEEKDELTEVLQANQTALRRLYSAPASGRSRYPVRLQEGFTMELPHLAKLKPAVSLLTAEGLMHATDGDAERATQAFLAAGRVADSVADEPALISQLVRFACWGIILPRLERALSLATFTDGQLAELQKVVAMAERPQAAVRGLAAEQACGIAIFTDPKIMTALFNGFKPVRSKAGQLEMTSIVSLFRISGLPQRDKAFYLASMGRQIAAMERPYPARFAAGQQVAGVTNLPGRFYIVSRMMLPGLQKFQLRDAEHTALVRVATTALAIERFRVAHANALPDHLEQLAPSCCPTVPADPFDGQPLRYKKHSSSYAVYSLGNDAQDNGGVSWDAKPLKTPQDVGFVVKH
jgi:hypothetical protein